MVLLIGNCFLVAKLPEKRYTITTQMMIRKVEMKKNNVEDSFHKLVGDPFRII